MLRSTALVLLTFATVASADPYDFRLYKLGNPQCGELSGMPCAGVPGGTNFRATANGNFRVFVRQLAAALTAATLMPPETLGHAGFAFAIEASVVQISEDPTGAGGVTFPTQQASLCDASAPCGASGYQNGISGPVVIPSVHIRKGLPYSFELGGRVGWLEKSRMFMGTVELKWAINEGFTYLPDIAVGGRVSKLINSRDFDVTTGGLDVSVGKQFALGGMVTLTPYAGWNLMFVGASSNPVDFDPARSLAKSETRDDQFRDIYVFESVSAGSNTHNRFYGGLRFVASPFMLGAEVSYTLIGSFRDDNGVERKVPSVVAGNFMLGVDL
ncbi:MAG: hypothetical protein JNK82_36400 [Myxococcaceae bacterium]|nr:hypothetical protein [Myxococcaceae bacterium]